MTPAPTPANETERLAALAQYDILDTPADAEFDDFTWLASRICGTPIALISLVDAERQWFKSKVGLAVSETPRELAFCAHVILESGILEVPNALEDERFADNLLGTGAPGIRFYAGSPLTTPAGMNLGTLCVIDRVPRQLSAEQRESLTRLGRQVVAQLELGLAKKQLEHRLALQEQAENALLAKNEELERALKEVQQLQGILPICMYCKKIRNDGQFWQEVEVYVQEHTAAQFSHGICPECCETWKQKHTQ